ncbi:glycosyltransferase family 1 protein [Mucilaginibacter sp. RS28]|uniref:Glycosyltransferase family 1 protein n=1 Tax=Mucilaginibacter straminoryzae TaxID=2932774 RepID=A0A9X1X4V2_9SPHI|nr:glycosyltransferase [Mucilaginibacter straminoryzae]MCJ8208684.1 glycosyltransferase family 1 protein [Mucilaginibacter straminoryzae]
MIQSIFKIFTWNVNPAYLFNLSQANVLIYVPVKDSNKPGYQGRGNYYPYPDNVVEVPASEVCFLDIDAILFQSKENYLHDQYDILSQNQRELPKFYLEHEPPRPHPTNSQHIVHDTNVTIVHVSHYNDLMWDNNAQESVVIEPGAPDAEINYSGNKPRGLVLLDHLPAKGRWLGLDVFLKVREHIPLDLIGHGNGTLGVRDASFEQLPYLLSEYRFVFSPVRYSTSCQQLYQAMMAGAPVVGLATVGLSTVVTDSSTGFVSTNVNQLIRSMQQLIDDRDLAGNIGKAGQQVAKDRFSLQRFIYQWESLLTDKISKKQARPYLALV